MFGYEFGDAVDRLLLNSALTTLLAIGLPALHLGALVLSIRQKRAHELIFAANILVAGLVAFYFLAQPEYFGDMLDFSAPGLDALIAVALLTIAAAVAGWRGVGAAVIFSGFVFAIDLAILVLGGLFALLFSVGEHR